jgi:hypothetical protein
MEKIVKKYRLGNQSEEYELREDYLGWTPENDQWFSLLLDFERNMKLTIVNPENDRSHTLYLHHFIAKDAFPLSFLRERRASKWFNFAIVSDDENLEKFIIPLH